MLLDGITATVADRNRALIVGHDYPDPDCLASAWGVQRLLGARFGLESDITFGGFIGRAANRAMVDLLRIAYLPVHTIDMGHYDCVVMVDTQPGTGNNSFDGTREVDLVIDHHPSRDAVRAGASVVVENCGSTTAVVAELLFESETEVDSHLATALFLGIKTDTLALGREFCKTDWRYYLKLFPLVDHRLLSRIERPDLRPEYYRQLTDAFEATTLYGAAAASHMGTVPFPEAVAEIADLLLMIEDVEWVLCSGVFRGDVFFSLRMRNASGDCGELARTMVKGMGTAGGHEEMAGGKLSVGPQGAEAIVHVLTDRFLSALRIRPETGKPLY